MCNIHQTLTHDPEYTFTLAPPLLYKQESTHAQMTSQRCEHPPAAIPFIWNEATEAAAIRAQGCGYAQSSNRARSLVILGLNKPKERGGEDGMMTEEEGGGGGRNAG